MIASLWTAAACEVPGALQSWMLTHFNKFDRGMVLYAISAAESIDQPCSTLLCTMTALSCVRQASTLHSYAARVAFALMSAFHWTHAYLHAHANDNVSLLLPCVAYAICLYGSIVSMYIVMHTRPWRRSSRRSRITLGMLYCVHAFTLLCTLSGLLTDILLADLTCLTAVTATVISCRVPDVCFLHAVSCTLCLTCVAVAVTLEAVACPYVIARWPAVPLHVLVELSVACATISAYMLVHRLDNWDKWFGCV